MGPQIHHITLTSHVFLKKENKYVSLLRGQLINRSCTSLLATGVNLQYRGQMESNDSMRQWLELHCYEACTEIGTFSTLTFH